MTRLCAAWLLLCGMCTPFAAFADPEPTLQDLVQQTQAQLQVGEDSLTVLLESQFRLERAGKLDFDRQVFVLPLLVPAVRGAVLDRGVIPQVTDQITVEAEGALTAQRRDGGLQVRGVLEAGTPAVVRAQYTIPFKASQLGLALQGRAGRTLLTVYVIAAPPVRAQVALDRPSRPIRMEEGTQRVVGAALAQALKPGEVAALTLTDLPAPLVWPQRMLLILGALAVLAAVTAARAFHPTAERLAARQ